MGGFLTKVPRAFFWLVTIAVAAIFLIFLAQPAFAAPKKGFEALQVSAPKSSFTIEPGSEKTITLEFQNIGITTWKNSGNAYVSVYTYGPKYRASIFRANNWVDYTQGALLKESSVAPQKVGTIELSLKAPLTEGEYKETFNLAAENKTWIPGGEFTLTIKVTKASSKDPSASLGMTKGVSSDGVASPVFRIFD
ncbi:hypothetical protein HY771_01130 [Candidatus Uhrbacteria bacterium]|nr:hypothetical protein [Candidatus Uhrbacteria bacterium]